MKALKYIWLTCLAIITVGFVSCSDDDDVDTKGIKVTQIYLEDAGATVTDRPVDFVRLGQLIRIEGSGFEGLMKLYINGYDTYFNTAYITDNSMLVQVSSKTPVSTADESVRNTIRFVKKGSEYTHPFTIRAASPYISSFSNTLPMPGETVIVKGGNLEETSEVTLPGGVVVTDITNAPEEESGEWFSFVMPTGVSEGGSVTMVGANGTAVSAEYFNNKNCMILDFDGNGTQGFWSWSETGSMIDDTDLVDDPLGSRGKVVEIVPKRLLDAGVAASKPRVSECWTAGNDDAADDWSRMYPYIPETTPLTDIAFQFDIYVPKPWSGTGHIQVCLFNNFNFAGIGSDDDGDSNQVAFYCPWIQDGKVVPFVTNGWETVTIPLSEFNKYAVLIADGETPTFADVVTDRNASSYRNFGMGFVNTDFTYQDVAVSSTVFSTPIYLDNWRIVPCKSTTISDFPDEEEAE